MPETQDRTAGFPDLARHAPEAKRGLAALTRAGSGLDHRLSELVKTRVSQINGCDHCTDLHAAALRADGESPERVEALPAWRDSALFDARERAALALAEAFTTLPDGAPDPALYAEAARECGEEEAALVAMTTIAINAWNRYMIATGA